MAGLSAQPPFELSAAKVWKEPKLTDAATGTNVHF